MRYKLIVLGIFLTMLLSGLMPLTSADDDYPPYADVYVEAIPEASDIDMLSQSEFDVSIFVDPDWQTVDTVSTDYLYWTPGIVELVGVSKGDFFSGSTAEVGISNVTPLPDNSISPGNTKNWNMSTPYILSQMGGDKTGITFYAESPSWGQPPWPTKYIDYALEINGIEVENDTFTATWDAYGVAIDTDHNSYLSDWISSGVDSSDDYLDITLTVFTGGVDNIGIRKVDLFSTDSHKRYLVWGDSSTTSNSGYFMNLTFKPLQPGSVDFYMGYDDIIVANGGVEYPVDSTNCTFNITAGDAPIVSNENPSDTATGIDPTPAVSATFSDPDLDFMDIYINVTNADGGSTSDHWTGVGDGQRTIATAHQNQIATFGKTYTWTVWASDGYNPPVTDTYTFTLRNQHEVGEPPSFVASTSDKNTIDLLWSKGENATDTVIVAKLGSYPSDITDGTELYNGTGTSTTHSGLNPEEDWYYRAWSWDSVDEVMSATYAQDTASTPANDEIILSNENPTNDSLVSSSLSSLSIDITDPEDGLIDYTIECSNLDSISESNVADGTKTLSLSSLTSGTTYTWWVNATDDEGVTTSRWYTFDTIPNQPPAFSNENPVNGSIDQELDFTWFITIQDPDGDAFDWTIECNGQSSNANGATNGTKSLSLSGLSYSTTYTIWVNASDTEGSTSEWYEFTTKDNELPVIGTPTPSNGTADQPLSFTWEVPISDSDELIDWTIECNGQSSNGNNDISGTKTLALTSLSYSTTYTVYVNATDGIGWTREWFTFTTVTNDAPNVPSTTYPSDGATDVDPEELGWNGKIQVLISDPEGHDMDVDFYWGNDTLFYTAEDIESGQLAEASVGTLEENTQYYWYVNITDEYGATTRGPATGNWTFTTGELPAEGGGGIGPATDNNVMFLVLEEEDPVSGATITVAKSDVTGQVLPQAYVRTASTDEDGRYSFTLKDGYYSLSIQAPGYETHEETLQVTGERSYVIYMEPIQKEQPLNLWIFAFIAVIIMLVIYGLYQRNRANKNSEVMWNMWN